MASTSAGHPGTGLERAEPCATIPPLIPLSLAAIAMTEAAALAAHLAVGGATATSLIAIHLLTLAVIGLLVAHLRRSGHDVAYPMLALITGAAVGPVGILGAGVLALREGRSRTPSHLVTDWYERIALSTTVAPEERLCEDVNVGRTLDLGAPLPTSYSDAMTAGPLAERQAILGHIARHFHPAYLPALKIALASPEPAIRVQAAAVAAHISPKVRRVLHDAAAAAARIPATPIEALAVLDDLETLVGSGLLDETERQRATALAARLGDSVLAALAGGPLALPFATDVAAAASLDARLEHLLVARHRFADLRAHRTARRLRLSHPRARLKRLAVRRDRPEAAA